MAESPTQIAHETQTPRGVEELAIALANLDPKPVTNFTPDNLDSIMEDFLSGENRNPDNATYSKLDDLDFDNKSAQYLEILEEIRNHPGIPKKHLHVYESFVQRSLDINELMRQAVLYRTASSEEERDTAQEQFNELNKRLYGEPQTSTAAAMVSEVINDTSNLQDPSLLRIREEFINLLPADLANSGAETESLEPSDDARETIDRAVELMYSPLLKHADVLIDQLADEGGVTEDKLKIGPQAIAVIFQTIIDKEFSESGWGTVIGQANAIYVDPATKTVKVPEERIPATANKVRGLVVHELGVHMLRSIIGEKADLIPLRFGLSGVGEAEEGIAKVMESALTDDASRTGYQHYLTATILGKGYDFRSTFEIMWRYKVLDKCLEKPKSDIDQDFIDKQKEATFKFMFRSIRGTNKLPWHVTLNYFDGTHKIWEYVERYKGDPDFISIMFMGKIDPTNEDHLHGAFDAKGRV